jgi:hydroxyacyl-ACP dehydratase HTD2-like protein with hotdog domain
VTVESLQSFTRTPDAVDLFTFSASVWLLHRIHYDQNYTTRVEGHPTLLLHGPLQAVYLTQVIRLHFGPDARLVRFRFRHNTPVYLGDTLLCGGEIVTQDPETGITTCNVWTEKPDGSRATVGVAEVETGKGRE